MPFWEAKIMRLRSALLALLPTLANAQTPLSAEEFEAFVEGGTFTVGLEGEEPYGIGLYLPGRRTIWARYDDQCYDGTWYEAEPGLICFVYPDIDGPEACWRQFPEGERLRLELASNPGATYYETPTDDTVPCLAPFLGS